MVGNGNICMSNYKKIEDIINKNSGYITRKEIDKANIPSAFLSQFVRKNNLIKLAPGFYAKKDWMVDDYLIFQYQYPKLIYSFYSSAFLHQLGDSSPSFLEVTAPKNYRPFALPRNGVVLHTDTRNDTYYLGICETTTVFGNKVRAYDQEKTVCDFIKNREKIDSESFVKCLNWYKRKSDKNIHNLMKYAQIMKIENKVNNIMEVILNDD